MADLIDASDEAREDDLGMVLVLELEFNIILLLTVARTMVQSSHPTDLTMKLLTYRRRKTVNQHIVRKTVETAIIGTVQ